LINFLAHPIRKSLAPLDIQELKTKAIASLVVTMKRPAPYQHGDDFGDFMDMEVAEEMIRVCEEKCHFFGRFFTGLIIHDRLVENLHLTNMMRAYPEIEKQRIVRPIFLSAFTRTGATFLYQVLSDVFDQELGHVKAYEVMGGPVEVNDPPNRKNKSLEAIEGLHAMVSPLKLMHEYTKPNDPEEDSGWYLNSMRGVIVPFILTSQKLMDMTFKATDSPLYNHRFLEANLKLKQWEEGKGTQRFLLKAPEHLFGISNLAKKFRGAKFVTVFRDEVPMFRSGVSLTYHYQHMFVDPSVDDAVLFTGELICAEREALRKAHNGKYKVMKAPFERLFSETFELATEFAKHVDLPWDAAKQEHARVVIENRLSWKKTKAKYKMHEFMNNIMVQDSKGEEDRKIAAHLDETCK